MIIVTGAAGFIGSCLVQYLNNAGIENIVLVDDFSKEEKNKNFENKHYLQKIERDVFEKWFAENAEDVDFVYHIGARTDTTEFDVEIFNRLNLNYSKTIWNTCSKHNIPLVYASSAATYGDGALGYDDNHLIVDDLKPLNPYGESKNDFDKWALQQNETPPFWAGLKFFNVYGPNEYHKGRMASVIWHTKNQIEKTGAMKLFRSHNANYNDGEQLRDFVYVKDVCNVCLWLKNNKPSSGLYNLGTGKARTFNDLVSATFNALDLQPDISYIDTPIDIRDKYQYFTEANMQKLIDEGYNIPFSNLEEGIADYVKNYLVKGSYL